MSRLMTSGMQKKIPITKILYVDGKREDVYIEDGSLTYPFKTIQGAINKAVEGERTTILIAPGLYMEQLTLKGFVNLSGYVMNSVMIQYNNGEAVIAPSSMGGKEANLKDLLIKTDSSLSTVVTLRLQNNGVVSLENAVIGRGVAGSCVEVESGGFMIAFDSSFTASQGNGVNLRTGSTGYFYGCSFYGKSTEYDLYAEAGSSLTLDGSCRYKFNRKFIAGTLTCASSLKSIQFFDSGSLPVASESLRGQEIYIYGGAGVADKKFICIKDSLGNYVWKEISLI